MTNKKKRIEFGVDLEEYKQIEEKAKQEGLKPSSYAKRLTMLSIK